MKKSTIVIIASLFVYGLNIIAQTNGRNRHKENMIEAQLNAIDSSIVKTFSSGTNAMDEGNLQLADSLYSIVYSKAPDFDPLLRRLGDIKMLLGQTSEGISLCKKAVKINRTAYNLSALAHCYLIDSDSTNLRKAQFILNEVIKLPEGDEIDFIATLVQVSWDVEDYPTAEKAINLLKKKYPDDLTTYYYNAYLLASKEKWFEAKKEIMKAKSKGLEQSEVDRFLDSGVSTEVNKINAMIYFGILVGIWLVGLLLLFVVGKIFSNITIKAIEKNKLETSSAKPGGWLRTGYKSLINIGGIYYYISLPIILAMVVVATLGVIYLFFIAGTLPIKLIFILLFAAGATIYGMIRSLLVKVNYTDPGRELKPEEAPGLFKLTNEVAQQIGTRPIDEIRITPFNDLAVYEKGTWREKLNDKAKRVLILGTSALTDFKKEDFKSVLAHEYGHFANRDTAGGEIALRVQNDMTNYFIALHNAEQNTVWNMAFHFLRLYNFIFRRISHGATRLQEVLADRVAAETFGPQRFVNGLSHVIKREIEFRKYANLEADQAVSEKRPLNNLYEIKSNNDPEIIDELTKSLSCKTTEDDTHPSPIDRFRYIKDVHSDYISTDNSFVSELFNNWQELTNEMTTTIDSTVDRY